MGTTATVTLLFCDLVGSTDLLSRVGDQAGDDVRHDWVAALRDAVAAHRGTEVKNLGDGLMVAFGSAADAVACAVAMQLALARLGRRRSMALRLRVGISSGEVSTEEGDYFGTPVVEAARLCAAAAPGQVLAAGVVRALVGSRSPAPLTDVGRLELKGLTEPVAAVSVEWAGAADELLPMPPVLAATDRHEFIGRVAELEQLAGELEAAGDGRLRLVLLPGEPGIGKTTLAAELARRAHRKGFTVLWGRCDEEALVPYQPFVEALEHWANAARRTDLDAIPEPVAAELARLVPRLAVRRPGLPQVPRDDAESQRYGLFEAVAALFEEMAVMAPVLLVLDDLHWSDGASLLLLRHLVRRPRTGAVTVVVTYRDSDVGRTHPLANVLADLRREAQSARVPLKGFGEDEVEAVLVAGGIEPGSDGHALARSLYRATEGNPLFVHETLRHLQESGALSSSRRGWRTTTPIERLGIPEGIKDVFGRRLSRLSPEADGLLGLAAVVGRVFDLDVLALVSEADEDALVDRLEEAARAGLVQEVPGVADEYSFSHPLVRETIYDEISASRRVRLHRRIAQALEALSSGEPGPRLGPLAYHYCSAGEAGDLGKAATYSLRAAEQALDLLAYEEAARLYRMGLDAVDLADRPDLVLRCNLLIGLGGAQTRAGEPNEGRTAFGEAAELARRNGDPERLAQAAVGRQEANFFSNTMTSADPAALELLDEARMALGEADDPLRVLVLASLAAAIISVGDSKPDQALAMEVAREGLDVAERLGNPRLRAHALHGLGWALWGLEHIAEAVAAAGDQVRLAEQVNDRELAMLGRSWRMFALLSHGDVEGFDADLSAIAALASEVRNSMHLGACAGWHAMRALMEGKYDDAERFSNEAFTVLESVHSNAGASFLGTQMSTRLDALGRLAELEPLISSMIESGSFPDHPGFAAFRAYLYARLGRLGEATASFEKLAGDGFAGLPRGSGSWMPTMEPLVLACAALDDRPRATLLYERLLPYSDQLVVTGPAIVCTGSVQRLLGVLAAALGHEDEAAGHFEAAVETNARVGAVPYVALTQLEYARMLIRRDRLGDRARAAELIGSARATAEALGMGWVLAQTSELAAMREK